MKNKSTLIMLGAGLLLQLITIILTEDTWLAFISGIVGVYSVVFCSERKMSYYIWSLIQILTFSVICWESQLYGKLIEQLFYLVTMGIGIRAWLTNADAEYKVKTRSLNIESNLRIIAGTAVGWSILYMILAVFTDCSRPFLDSITTVLAITAQLLMVLRYKENWLYWMAVDVLCIILFASTQNWCMTAQYVFWTINTIYGYMIWNKSAKSNNTQYAYTDGTV